MKIDLSPPKTDREPAIKSAPQDNGARRDQGRAFDAAIRDAKPPQRDAASGQDAAKPDAAAGPQKTPAKSPEPKAETGGASASVAANASEDTSTVSADETAADETKTDETATDGKDARSLQSLLGLLTQAAAASAKDKAPSKDEDAHVARTLVPDDKAAQIDPDAAEELSGGKAVRLDVLKMETHFEPHQDGMVLVRADAETEKAAAEAAATKQAKGAGKGAADETASLLAGLADKKSAQIAAKDASDTSRAGEAKDAKDAKDTTTAGSDGEAELPVRFDEALARLSGRGRTSGGSGGDAAGGRGDRREAAADAAARSADASTTKTKDVAANPALAGAGGLGLATQIADRMLEVLGEPAARPAPSAGTDSQEHLRMRAGGAALKTLTIQLKPEHLGTLDVSMRLSEGRLTVELAASRADTAVLLSEDRGALRQLLERAGFSVDDAAITVVAKDIQPNATRAADGSAGTGGGDGSGGGTSSGQTFREGSESRGGEGGRSPRREEGGAPAGRDETPARARSSTYL
ncbi:flagellar hook-length control protein FliK [Aureimonas ureilytica]|uniref:flagellar hook-length control protein FliK n=2 Tax=Aureimonas ureilytica TaxID=401562 RepID=UPI00037CF51F|nr:flagellar hook-length control protein FliK [Aureimonas ureilytica]